MKSLAASLGLIPLCLAASGTTRDCRRELVHEDSTWSFDAGSDDRSLPVACVNSDLPVRSSERFAVLLDTNTKQLEVVALSREEAHAGLLCPKSEAVCVAGASWNDLYNKTGWSHLHVDFATSPDVATDLSMYAGGYLEGFLSAHHIAEFRYNTQAGAKSSLQTEEAEHQGLSSIHKMLLKGVSLIEEKGNMKEALVPSSLPKDPWWSQARHSLMQLEGVRDGFNSRVPALKPLQPYAETVTLEQLMVLNSDGETPELMEAFDKNEVFLRESEKLSPLEVEQLEEEELPASPKKVNSLIQQLPGEVRPHVFLRGSSENWVQKYKEDRRKKLNNMDDKAWLRIKRRSGRCSALIRLLEDKSDLMVGHTTFSDFMEMTRVFKYYRMPPLAGATEPFRIGFSSYPGVVSSTDDFYVTSNKLVVTETTISMLTDEAYDKLDDKTPHVPDFMRIMMSNRLSKSGEDWVKFMNQSATGTYSSQWMVVDYNKFAPSQPLPEKTFLVLEQVPTASVMQDMTQHLQETGFWASENRAYFKPVRVIAGFAEVEAPTFSTDNNARGTIFSKEAPQVTTLPQFRSLLQRNLVSKDADLPTDWRTPDHAIAARSDLAPKDEAFANGGVDGKAVNACMAGKLKIEARSGPTHDDAPVFSWTDLKTKLPTFPDSLHEGMPDTWNFDWVMMSEAGIAGHGVDRC